MKKILVIIGARPQFIKHASFELAAKSKFEVVTLHTGQHYDDNMSKVFFDELGMQRPTYQLNLGGGSHGIQTGTMMIEIEKIIKKENPDFVVVYGDTNSTLAGALVAAKLSIKLVHIEAGLRSFNKGMPEEINRVLTDHVSDLLFVPSEVAKKNLERESILNNIFVVGDIMKDLVLKIRDEILTQKSLNKDLYYYATIHRPYNTDNKERLIYVLKSLNRLSEKVILSIHPRTNALISEYDIDIQEYSNISVIPPQSYTDNLAYLANSSGLITDSGGMQKEAYWLQKKCVTIRTETEWLETITLGANVLMFENLNDLDLKLKRISLEWDQNLYGFGDTSKKIVEIIEAR